jgi:hypothetical protein
MISLNSKYYSFTPKFQNNDGAIQHNLWFLIQCLHPYTIFMLFYWALFYFWFFSKFFWMLISLGYIHFLSFHDHQVLIIFHVYFCEQYTIFVWKHTNDVLKFFSRLKCESEMKTTEEQRVEAHSLAHSTLRVEGCARTLRWDYEEMTSNLFIHSDLHKPNNTLVSA